VGNDSLLGIRWTLTYESSKTNCNPCDLSVEVVTFNFLLSAMASREKKKSEIQALLEDQNVETIFLTGEAGVGKTWIAEQMSDFASSKGLSYMTFWVFLNQQPESMSFYRGNSLYENFARQLSLLPDFEDWEEDGKEDVDTVFSMVTCRMMIRLVLYDLQNNKHCVGGGADDPPPMLK
jgi:hypothetical protein